MQGRKQPFYRCDRAIRPFGIRRFRIFRCANQQIIQRFDLIFVFFPRTLYRGDQGQCKHFLKRFARNGMKPFGKRMRRPVRNGAVRYARERSRKRSRPTRLCIVAVSNGGKQVFSKQTDCFFRINARNVRFFRFDVGLDCICQSVRAARRNFSCRSRHRNVFVNDHNVGDEYGRGQIILTRFDKPVGLLARTVFAGDGDERDVLPFYRAFRHDGQDFVQFLRQKQFDAFCRVHHLVAAYGDQGVAFFLQV